MMKGKEMNLAVETFDLNRTFKLKKAKNKGENGNDNGKLIALENANIKIHQGELFGLLGPNGAGKTTLIKILATLLLPTSGTGLVDGIDVVKYPEKVRKKINMVSGGEHCGYGILTVRETLWMFSQFYGIATKVAHQRIDELLKILKMEEFAKTKIGYQIKAYGLSPAAARYAGVSSFKIPLVVFIMGGLIAGLAGYHYFAAVPGVYKIARTYGYFGDLAFYGIICGLISQGNPLAAIPVALLFGGLTNGGRFVQGKLQLGFGVDFALLGVLMITLVAFQFFYRYRLVLSPSASLRTGPSKGS